MTTAALPIPRRRARLSAYLPWHFRDFVAIGMLSAILFGLLGTAVIMQMHLAEASVAARVPGMVIPLAQKLEQFLTPYGMFAVVAPIICMTGLASQDRQLGYTRFLFAKPVSVRAYYLSLVAVRFVGFVLLGHILLLAYGHFEPPAYTWRFLVEMTVSFVAVGGIVFLLSVVSRYDGLFAVLWLLLATIIRARFEAPGVGHLLTYLFPPIEHGDAVRRWAVSLNSIGELGAMDFPWKWMLWNGGYGLACLLMGLYLLRRIPLTKA
ncbi:MAG TPA: hypothetical protein VGM82_12550 [Gemmatimonadaceae bacterium]|jgi:hypothetical protein